MSMLSRFRRRDQEEFWAICGGSIPDANLEARWYASLEAGAPDYRVYHERAFLRDLWFCWVGYSRRYLMMVSSPRRDGRRLVDQLGDVGSVIDLGCGAGYTTAALKEMWPTARVIGTNLPGTPQYEVAAKLSRLHGFEVASRVEEHADLVFASEYFEHFEWPITHLREVLDCATPKALVIANSFGSRSTGHFPEYKDLDRTYSNKRIGRVFNSELRSRGYQKMETGFWNGRPTVWRKS